jgi:hypothetical protein
VKIITEKMKKLSDDTETTSNHKLNRKLFFAVIAVIIMVIALVGVYSVTKQNQSEDTFDVAFSVSEIEITENSTGFQKRAAPYYDAWRITVHKLTDDVLRDVDIWAYNQDGFKIVRHYDYLGGKQVIPLSLYHIKNHTMIVDIYWEGGYAGFFCAPWE